jgi:hypothetical protein
MSTPNTYHLLRLVRNLRTGNLPTERLNAELARIRAEREAREAAERGTQSTNTPPTEIG